MPSRFVVLAIVLFWVAAMGWLVAREIAPSWRAGEPPTIVFGLADEIGANTTNWTAHMPDKEGLQQEIGAGESSIRRRPDRSFELKTWFKFKEFSLFAFAQLKRVETIYRVTNDGRLLSMEIKANAETNELKVKGTVADGLLTPQFFWDEKEVTRFALQPIKLDRHDNVLNPMHLVNKVGGLYEGKTWTIPLLDPSDAIKEAWLKALLQASKRPKELLALVKLEDLDWHGQSVPCFRIDYAPPGEKFVASTWVRRRDGLVLQQEAELLAQKIQLRRDRPKN